MEFKDRIRELRTTTNISATDLAAGLGKSVSAIRMWETGKAKPDADTLLKLTDFFQVSADYLLGKDECKTPEDKKIKELLGLTDSSIDILKNAQQMKGVVLDLEDKLFVINHIIDTMNISDYIKIMHMYLFEGFGFPIPGDKEHYHEATEIVHGRKGGRIRTTMMGNNEFSDMYFGKMVTATMELKDMTISRLEPLDKDAMQQKIDRLKREVQRLQCSIMQLDKKLRDSET